MAFTQMSYAIGMYSKGWYGNSSPVAKLDELRIIIGHLCGMDTKYIPEYMIFTVVQDVFNDVVVKERKDYAYEEFFKELLNPIIKYEPYEGLSQTHVCIDLMLRGIHLCKVVNFPDGKMVFDPEIAKLFPNGDERIARYKEMHG